MDALDDWVDQQYRVAATGMLRSISALRLVKRRPGFGQELRPLPGSVIASPVLGAYDPDPDYFFHWFRDSAIVMDALRLLCADGTVGAEAHGELAAFVRFSRGLDRLDGRRLAASPAWRGRIAADFERHVRSDAELAGVFGEQVLADTRVNPDATLDISKWARPQNDGAPLRALTLLRWAGLLGGDPASVPRTAHAGSTARAAPESMIAELGALLRLDLAWTRRHAREPCFDIWEEEKGSHYFTLRVSAAALEDGAEWLEGAGERAEAQACRAEAQAILRQLDRFWLPEPGFYRSRILEGGARSAKELDIAVVLATIHARGRGPRHSARDPRVHSTLARLEELFQAEYPINQRRPPDRAPALGRYPDDRYYSGGAYYFSTLGAAELCFRAAIGTDDANALRERGNAFLRTVRAFTPANGEMSEQFDRSTGMQTSARQLAWSYAAFISCIDARRAAAA